MATILIVDDFAEVRSAVRRVLEGAGHDVVEAANGKEAVTACDEHDPALVLIDLFMPVMDGFQLMQELRISSPTLVMIAMSGGSGYQSRVGEQMLAMAGKLGASSVLSKPIGNEDLLLAVQQALSGESARDPR